jgi:hypothetical protein
LAEVGFKQLADATDAEEIGVADLAGVDDVAAFAEALGEFLEPEGGPWAGQR